VTDDLMSRCALLGEGWRWWATTLEAMDDDAWGRPTRLEGWDVAGLVAHHSFLVAGIRFLATHPVAEPPVTPTARDMLRRFNVPGGIATTSAPVVEQAARQRATTTSHGDLIAKFLVEAPTVVASARDAGPIVVDYFGNGTFPIAEAVAIAIMEAVVHGLDLADAVGAPPDNMPAGTLRFTSELLASIADPVAFVEAATGRRSADVLPVIR
jgi:uncharacterized protein (TIGR03083 family)